MPRQLRASQGGLVYHVLNRANARMALFPGDGDYAEFVDILRAGVARSRMRLLAYCLMPNHWHLVLWPRRDGDLSEFLRRVTVTHAHRWHAACGTAGTGHVYQGRFKSFLVQDDRHLWTVCRYVERNALRARLCRRAEEWRWGSAWYKTKPQEGFLSEWPEPRPEGWLRYVNEAQTEAKLSLLRQSVVRGCPFGGESWMARVVTRLGLEATLRPRGRPRKSGRKCT